MTPPAPFSPAASAFRAARRLRVEAARTDVNVFLEFVLRDEESGAPIKQGAVHRAWHQLLDLHPRLVLWSAIASGKTASISIGRVLWALGRDPSLRVVIVSNAAAQAEKIIRTIGQYVARSRELREVFPSLKPATPWNTSMLTVERTGIAKDPSVQATSVHGNILGARTDLLIVDDLLDYENCRTPGQREDVIGWTNNALLGRLSSRGRVVIVGVAQNREDLMHHLAALPAWAAYRFGVEDAAGNPRWWPRARIDEARRTLSLPEQWRQLDCVARGDDSAIISESWVQVALARGERATILEHRPEGLYLPDSIFANVVRVVLGVDPAFSTKRTADLSALAAVAVHRDGSREVLAIESGRWHGPVLIEKIRSARRRFGARSVAIESNGGQALLGQWIKQLEGEGVDVVQVTTGRGTNSMQARVEQLASELASGRWILPSQGGRARDRELEALVRDLVSFTPRAHTGDRLAALLIAAVGSEGEEEVGEVGWLDLRR